MKTTETDVKLRRGISGNTTVSMFTTLTNIHLHRKKDPHPSKHLN